MKHESEIKEKLETFRELYKKSIDKNLKELSLSIRQDISVFEWVLEYDKVKK